MADIKVRVGQQNATKVISSLAGAQTLSLTELSDVNVSGTLQSVWFWFLMVLRKNLTQHWS